VLTLPELIHSATPRARTDRLKVVAGLYCLGAHRSPVTARQVVELLALHLGKQAPPNVSKCLRRYKTLIVVADRGPPLKWSLTDDGIVFLRNATKRELPSTPARDYASDVAIVCALEFPEFAAVIEAAGGAAKWRESSDGTFAHVYRETSIVTNEGKSLRVVGATSTSMGLTAAAIVTTQLIMQYRPRLVVMIGIAAGTRQGNKEFGDILVADPSVDYASGKVAFSGGVREFLPDPYPLGLNPRLRAVLQKYQKNHRVFDEMRERWTGKLPTRANRLYIGPLGAADQVIDDASRILEIQRNWRKLIGVEMETYGVYRACFESPDPKPRFVSFKAVCDFAAEKADSWQDYAAFAASYFAVHFLKSDWRGLWPTM
jgi:nucleoside phosphorylase